MSFVEGEEPLPQTRNLRRSPPSNNLEEFQDDTQSNYSKGSVPTSSIHSLENTHVKKESRQFGTPIKFEEEHDIPMAHPTSTPTKIKQEYEDDERVSRLSKMAKRLSLMGQSNTNVSIAADPIEQQEPINQNTFLAPRKVGQGARESMHSFDSHYSGVVLETNPVFLTHVQDNREDLRIVPAGSEKESVGESSPTKESFGEGARSTRGSRSGHSVSPSVASSLPGDDNDTSSVRFGKLQTNSNQSTPQKPSRHTETAIEPILPQRSSRRPKSMVISGGETGALHPVSPGKLSEQPLPPLPVINQPVASSSEQHNKSQSISTQVLNDLRRSANSSSPDSDYGHMKPPRVRSAENKRYSEFSTTTGDSYHTANIGSDYERPVPPRPTQENLKKAREASFQLSTDLERQNRERSVSTENDEDYVDIDTTERTQSTKSKKTKSKKGHKSKKSGSKMKPFTYETLMKLLESTNGTIIGEEFNHLNMPQEEIALIEKIVDALSRLSADMVYKDTAYKVGLKRLENALLALEGYL